MYHGRLAAGLRRRHIVARLDVHNEPAHDAEHAGAGGEDHRHEDVQLVGLDRDDAERIGVEDEADIDPAADDDGQAEQQVEPVRAGS